MRELLEACGAVRYLRPLEDTSLSWEERAELREQAGHAETSGQRDRITDWTLSGLEILLETLPNLPIEERRIRSELLWEELAHLEERRGKGVFTGEYKWTHYGSYKINFEAAFVRRLNADAWVPNANGELQRPEFVLFDTLGWKPNPFLQSKVCFKPPIIEQLAKEAGIEPGMLDLLKKLGLTNEAELRARLGMEDKPETPAPSGADNVDDAVTKLLVGASKPTPPVSDPAGPEPPGAGGGSDNGSRRDSGPGRGGGKAAGAGSGNQTHGKTGSAGGRGGKHTAAGSRGRTFISYVGTHPDEEEPDPDGLEQAARMALEEKAIIHILKSEPALHRTPTSNPGFDLFEPSADGQPERWVEVKSMTGELSDRPVGLSRTQFECAQEHGDAYWLYVVEHADKEGARIVRIQDPAGKARTFTFDHGWLGVAEVDI